MAGFIFDYLVSCFWKLDLLYSCLCGFLCIYNIFAIYPLNSNSSGEYTHVHCPTLASSIFLKLFKFWSGPSSQLEAFH